MPRKKKIEQITGKEETLVPTTLEQILGRTGSSKYGTLDDQEYKSGLEVMNKADLQTHASEVGLVPIEDRNRLIKSLVNEFLAHAAKFQRTPQKKVNKKPTAIMEKILSRGR